MDDVFVEEIVKKAMKALSEVAEDDSQLAKDRNEASKIMLEAVSQNYHDIRRVMMTSAMTPLLETVSKSLRGDADENCYSPVFELTAMEQANLALNMAKFMEGK